ncbi:MAG TPA: SDR family oxidoreductase [Dehalococcoidia bacterium]|jgi:uncharacterized protein YbjT (DUF2867 family)|nr:SDR family oxidoreductase [Dehalococcoidia bacterium]
MILVAGGTGTLGRALVALLTARQERVRVLTRDPARVPDLAALGVELVRGDVRDAGAVAAAVQGASTVVSAVHGFTGGGGNSPRAVDRDGNRTLFDAARTAGVQHVVLVSVHGAAPDHPVELMRMKYAAEQALRASGLAWTIIRSTVFMETWAQVIGQPLLASRRTRVFGRSTNAINFVSAHDVAQVIDQASHDPALRGSVLAVGGPENLTLREVAATFERVLGIAGRTQAVPLPVMRAMAVLLRPVNATVARQIHAGVVMETRDMTWHAGRLGDPRLPVPRTTFAEVIAREYRQQAHAVPSHATEEMRP